MVSRAGLDAMVRRKHSFPNLESKQRRPPRGPVAALAEMSIRNLTEMCSRRKTRGKQTNPPYIDTIVCTPAHN
jgi:hypothetical protein